MSRMTPATRLPVTSTGSSTSDKISYAKALYLHFIQTIIVDEINENYFTVFTEMEYI